MAATSTSSTSSSSTATTSSNATTSSAAATGLTPPSSVGADALATFRPPRGTAVLGMAFAVAAIVMGFGAGLIGYIVLRGRSDLTLSVPTWFWLSTLLLLISSVTLHGAAMMAGRGLSGNIRAMLSTTTALGALFIITQLPGLMQLLASHQTAAVEGTYLYPLVLFLVVLHAVHVLAGMAGLIRLTARSTAKWQAMKDSQPLIVMSMYWHSLTVVWMVMFSVFLLLG